MQRSGVFPGKSCLQYGLVLILTLVLPSAAARPTIIDPLHLVTDATFITAWRMNGFNKCCNELISKSSHFEASYDPGTYTDLKFIQNGFTDFRVRFIAGKFPRVDYFQDAVFTDVFQVDGQLSYSFIVYTKDLKRVPEDLTVPVNITATAEVLYSRNEGDPSDESTYGRVDLFIKGDLIETIVTIDQYKTFHKRTTKIWAKPYTEEYTLYLSVSTLQAPIGELPSDDCDPDYCKKACSRKMQIYADPVIEIDPTAYVTVDGKQVLATEVFDVALSGNLLRGGTTSGAVALQLLLED